MVGLGLRPKAAEVPNSDANGGVQKWRRNLAVDLNWNLKMVVVMWVLTVVLVVQVDETVQLSSNHPLHGVVDRINHNGGPYMALLMTYPTEESVLQASGLFIPNSDIPWVDLSGRRFNIGKIRGVNLIYVMSGKQMLNAGITVQVLVDVFDIQGIVHYGIAGSTNDSLSIGDVSVPKDIAFTGSWKWKEFHSQKGVLPELKFGSYNFPTEGDNLLGKLEFMPEEVYSNGQPMQKVFWLPVEPKWFNIASQLESVKLQECVNDTYCLPQTPSIVYGLRGSTADIFLDNAAYRKYLFNEFGVSTVDEESSAVVMACLTNGVPCIVFRGVSDLAGGGGETGMMPIDRTATGLSSLAAVNALSVAIEFIGLIGKANRDI